MVKSEQEIQKAHDVLWAFVIGDMPVSATPATIQLAHAKLEALCWVLGHEHNTGFEESLVDLMAEARRRGFVLTEKSSPI